FRVRTNVPGTAQSLRDNLRSFVNGASEAVGQAVSIAPYEDGREGPIWLPVPGHSGVVLQVDDPQPNAPLDADKPAGDARRVWDVTPARDLNGGETYELVLSQGLKTPLGALAGAHAKTVGTVTTFGNFAVEGITCLDANDDRQTVSVNGEADDFARCRPEGVQLQFSARVPRETLEMLAWEPELDAAETAGQAWDNY